MREWYRLSAQETMKALDTGNEGLKDREVRERLKRFGENRIRESERKQWWQVFLEQFSDLLVMILIGAAAISMFTGDPGSAGVIFAVLLLNAVLGTWQHQKAEKSLESLKTLSAPQTRVLRQGQVQTVPSWQLVPGDLMLLEAGDLAAADGRLIQAWDLKVNESSLTGESFPVEKKVQPSDLGTGEIPLAERSNMIFSGSLVSTGRGLAVAVATGMDTEIGKIAAMMNQTEEKKTPLQISLDHFSSRLAAGILAVSAGVFGLNLYRGQNPLDALMFAVALAVAAIPEALSSIVTIVQAMGTQKMAREHAVIKDLKAVESLGCVSVICSDKTGTLTQNRMKVEALYLNHQVCSVQWLAEHRKRGDARYVLLAAALNNNGFCPREAGSKETEGGDPMETALLGMVREAGADPEAIRKRCPRLGERAFDSRRRRMSVQNQVDGSCLVFVKGAPEVILERCVSVAVPKENHGLGERPITSLDRRRILDQNGAWAREGMRVLAFALGKGTAGHPIEERDLAFLAMTALTDPPRSQSQPAVAMAFRAGIRTVMITGDQKDTAAAVAGKIGILRPGTRTVTGAQLDQMDQAQLDQNLEQISVYARVSPEHKIRIVDAWQRKGHITAMTGDGVNDAPALKKADIGIAMGMTGTQVSREAASMILTDDNFATIIKAVANGRNVYRNIRNAIQFLLSGNMAGIFCVAYTSLLGLPMPFASVHLLFINLLTDSLPAIAIGMEPPEEDLLCQPPRDPRQGILTGTFLRDVLVQGGLIALAALAAYSKGLAEGGAAAASTMAFSTLTLARLFHGFNCRSAHSILRLGLTTNLWSLMAFELGTVFLAAVLFVPALRPMFAVVPLSLDQVLTVLAGALTPTLAVQAVKMIREWGI